MIGLRRDLLKKTLAVSLAEIVSFLPLGVLCLICGTILVWIGGNGLIAIAGKLFNLQLPHLSLPIALGITFFGGLFIQGLRWISMAKRIEEKAKESL